jgi:hypothetical protein
MIALDFLNTAKCLKMDLKNQRTFVIKLSLEEHQHLGANRDYKIAKKDLEQAIELVPDEKDA